MYKIIKFKNFTITQKIVNQCEYVNMCVNGSKFKQKSDILEKNLRDKHHILNIFLANVLV